MRHPAVSYDAISRWLHWSIAGLVLLQFTTGLGWSFFERGSPGRLYLFRTHLASGYVVLALAALRIGWRLRRPAPPLPAMSRPLAVAARATHGLLYLAILIQPALGIVTASAWGKTLGGWPGYLHIRLAYTIAAIVALHIAAALWHHFVWRDGLIHRMRPPRERALNPQAINPRG